MPITPSAGQTVNIYAGLTGTLPVSVSGNVTISGTVAVSQTNQQGMTVAAPVWVTGTVTVPGHSVLITGSTVTLPVSATNPVTASIANFPTTFPGNANITASITLPVSATNPVTASISNWPTTFPGNVNITGAIPLTATIVQSGFNSNITASITLPVSMTNAITATLAGGGLNVNVTASVPLTATIVQTGFDSNITASITLPVSMTNPVTATVTFPPSSVLSASVLNWPTDQLVHGLVEITASVTLPVSQTNPVTASVANFPTGFDVNNFPAGFLAEITASIPLAVTSTSGAPVWVTGAVTVNTGTGGGVSGYGTGSAAASANTGSLTLGSDGSNLWAIKVDSAGVVAVSSTNSPTFPAGFNSNITASIPLQVTSTISNPVWVTGSVIASGITISGTVNVSGSSPNVGQIGTPSTGEAAIDGGLDYAGNIAAMTVVGGALLVAVTSSITLPVSATNPVTASIANFPAGFNVEITASTGLTASVSNFPAGFDSNITASITLPVSATNPVNVANFPAKVDTVPSVPNPTQYYPVRLTDGTNYYNSTGGGSGSGGQTTVVVPPKQIAQTASLARVPQTASVTTLLGGNLSGRLGYTIFNSSSQGLNVSFTDNTAVSAAFKIGPFSTYDADQTVYGGTIYGLWDASGSGAAWVTEYTGLQAITGVLAVVQGSGSAPTTLYPWQVTFPSYNMSAFGSLRTANAYTLLDLVNKYGIDPFEIDTSASVAGNVSFLPNDAAIRLQTPVTSGSAGRFRTNTYFRYQAGRGQRIITTCAHDAAVANQERRWGYYDDNDGLYWVVTGSSFGFVRRTSTSGAPVNNFISQSAFNLDKFDGTGPSQQNLDLTKGNIYEIDFQWLGVGVVKLYINGLPVHQIVNPNTLTTVYMKTAVLPLAASVINNDTVASSGSGMKFFCANITSEGGQDPPEYGFSYGRSAIKTAITNAAQVPVLAIRLSQLFPSGTGQDNRELVLPTSLSIYAEPAAANKVPRCDWALVLNPTTLTTASWTAVDATSSGVERDEAATAFTGGTVIGSGRFQTNPNANAGGGMTMQVDLTQLFGVHERKMRRSAFAGTSDVLVLVAQSTLADNINVDATINWTEVR